MVSSYSRLRFFTCLITDLELPPLPQELLDYLATHERINPNDQELARIKANLSMLYEAGPGAKNVEQEENDETTEDNEGEEEIASGAHIPIPTETFLEELSVKMQLHPISVYWLLEELKAEGARCKPEELATAGRSPQCSDLASVRPSLAEAVGGRGACTSMGF